MTMRLDGRRGRFAASAAAVLLLAGGANTIRLGLHPDTSPVSAEAAAAAMPAFPPTSSPSPPQPTPTTIPAPSTLSSTGPPTSADTPTGVPSRDPSPPPATPVLPPSAPVALAIPQLGLHTNLIQLGLNSDGTLDVPPVQPGSPAGWYRYSPTPGQLGPSVILGHVNSSTGPIGVFSHLHELGQGSTVTITRADGVEAVFQVDRTENVAKANFPTLDVYGDTTRAELRLITCSDYDQAAHTWKSNTVVYAHLTSSTTA
jgi:LPXTG-site transpeptidase (sortase) family protein